MFVAAFSIVMIFFCNDLKAAILSRPYLFSSCKLVYQQIKVNLNAYPNLILRIRFVRLRAMNEISYFEVTKMIPFAFSLVILYGGLALITSKIDSSK